MSDSRDRVMIDNAYSVESRLNRAARDEGIEIVSVELFNRETTNLYKERVVELFAVGRYRVAQVAPAPRPGIGAV